VRDTPVLAHVRDTFGDEREDYAAALQRHYVQQPDPAYNESFITPYAASHPWEDWAETFAHYLHIQDTLETAAHFGFAPELARTPRKSESFERLIEDWSELTIALNALNHSMGLPDAYPFAISPRVSSKLKLVDRIVLGGRTTW
jgi:hypothetical protein